MTASFDLVVRGEPRRMVVVGVKGEQAVVRAIIIDLWGSMCVLYDAEGACGFCDRSFGKIDMHHAFLREGQPGSNHPYNCVMACHAGHMALQPTERLRRAAWKVQVGRYGADEVLAYLESVAPGLAARIGLPFVLE